MTDGRTAVGSFDPLSPDDAVRSVELALGIALDGTLDSYPSYVNRVYGMRREDGEALQDVAERASGRFDALLVRPGSLFVSPKV